MSDDQPAPQDADQDAGRAKDGKADGGAEDVTGLKNTVNAERTARKTAERELKAAQAKLGELEGRDKSDVERLTGERDRLAKEIEDARNVIRDRDAMDALRDALTEAKAQSVALAAKALRGDLEYDKDGAPTNVEALVSALKKSDPALFQVRHGSADGGSKGGNGQSEPTTPHERLARGYAQSATARRG